MLSPPRGRRKPETSSPPCGMQRPDRIRARQGREWLSCETCSFEPPNIAPASQRSSFLLEKIGEPFSRFLKLPSPSPLPWPEDTAITFERQLLPEAANVKSAWAGTISLDGVSPPITITADGHEVRIKGAKLSFPGGWSATAGPDGVLSLDYNYDFKTDLALAGAGGFKLYRQESNGSFTNVAGIPPSIVGQASGGVGGRYRNGWRPGHCARTN